VVHVARVPRQLGQRLQIPELVAVLQRNDVVAAIVLLQTTGDRERNYRSRREAPSICKTVAVRCGDGVRDQEFSQASAAG
jgi:hypothetical protein